MTQVKESDIIDLLEVIRTSIYNNAVMSEYIFNAYMKLTTRFKQRAQIDRIRTVLAQNTGNLDVELQQRAVEYENLFRFDQVRNGVMERMPAPEIREGDRLLADMTHKKPKTTARTRLQTQKTSAQQDLLDLLNDNATPTKEEPMFAEKARNVELLKGLFGPEPTANKSTAASGSGQSSISDIMGLFGVQGQSGTVPTTDNAPVSTLNDLFNGSPVTTQSLPQAPQTYRIT